MSEMVMKTAKTMDENASSCDKIQRSSRKIATTDEERKQRKELQKAPCRTGRLKKPQPEPSTAAIASRVADVLKCLRYGEQRHIYSSLVYCG